MKKENDELFDLFRTRLGNAEVEVRENIWEQLENDIPVVLLNRRRLLMRRFSAVASILILLAGVSASFWHFSPKDEIADAFTQIEIIPAAKGIIKNNVVKVVKEEGAPVKTPFKQPVVENMEDDTFTFSFSMSFSVKEYHTENQTNRNPDNRLAGGMDNPDKFSENKYQKTTTVLEDKKTIYKSGSIGLFTQLNPTLPLSIGITAQKNLSDRFSLETGLVYTKLDADQTLHYLGIPLKAIHSLYENKHFDLYASAGGMVEKSIRHSLKVDPLQLSLIAGLGIQYHINDKISIYAEPGLAYYFDSGSSVSKIRIDKPLNFNVLCGVRMTY